MLCRRYPPDAVGKWGNVHPEDWCGERIRMPERRAAGRDRAGAEAAGPGNEQVTDMSANREALRIIGAVSGSNSAKASRPSKS